MSSLFWWNRAPKRSKPTPAPPTAAPRLIRVTDERDGELVNRMYSYWANAWVSGATINVFAGHVDGVPRLFSVERATGQVERKPWTLPYRGPTEGWYFDAEGWIYLTDGPRLRRVNPFTGEDRIVLDISDSHMYCRLWQAHSSDDGQTHSATVQRVTVDGPYDNLGTVVWRRGRLQYFATQGALDESQVDASGRWLVIKENEDNRIIDLETDEERLLRDADGALGHSDLGNGFAVGENNQSGTCDYLDLATLDRRRLFQSWNVGYVSVRANRCLHSSGTHLNMVALDGSGLTPLIEHGGGTDYDTRVKANLSPCGQVACYMSPTAGRQDVYLLVL